MVISAHPYSNRPKQSKRAGVSFSFLLETTYQRKNAGLTRSQQSTDLAAKTFRFNVDRKHFSSMPGKPAFIGFVTGPEIKFSRNIFLSEL